MTSLSHPPHRIIHRFMPWVELFYNAFLASVFVIFAFWLHHKGVDWRMSLLPLVGTLIFASRLIRVRTIILIATEIELTIVRRPMLHWLGTFDIIPAATIRRLRYTLQVHEDRDSKGDRYGVDHFCLDVITHDSRIIKVIDSESFALPRKKFLAMANLLGAPYEESLNRPD